MAQAYSDDLRANLLQPYASGDGGLRQLANRFRVSYGWAQKILRVQRRTGKTERPAGRPRGIPSRLTPELREDMRLRLAQYPDATLAELQAWLEVTHTVIISVQGVSAVLVEMGWRRKKKEKKPARR